MTILWPEKIKKKNRQQALDDNYSKARVGTKKKIHPNDSPLPVLVNSKLSDVAASLVYTFGLCKLWDLSLSTTRPVTCEIIYWESRDNWLPNWHFVKIRMRKLRILRKFAFCEFFAFEIFLRILRKLCESKKASAMRCECEISQNFRFACEFCEIRMRKHIPVRQEKMDYHLLK